MKESRVRAIRWLTFSHNYNTGPEDKNLNKINDEELVPLCLEWEQHPDREVSCEIISVSDGSWKHLSRNGVP